MVEKIKMALERAYKEREGKTHSQVPVDSVNTSAVLEPVVQEIPVDVSAQSEYFLAETRYSVIDTDELENNRIVTFNDASEYAESFRFLRTKLLQFVGDTSVSTIGITSPSEKEGRTLIAVNLAISMVRSTDVNVVLVDADLSHPSIHSLLGLDVEFGLVDLLNGQVELTKVLHRINIPNLWVVPGRRERINLQDQNNANRVEELVSKFYIGSKTVIIVDLPPVLGRDDTLVFTSNLDGVVLVVEEGETKHEEVTRSMALLKQCEVIGTVMNKSIQKGAVR